MEFEIIEIPFTPEGRAFLQERIAMLEQELIITKDELKRFLENKEKENE